VCGRRRGEECSVVVELPDGTRSEIPEWMTEESATLGSELVERPVLSVAGLQALRGLLDALPAKKTSPGGSAVTPPRPEASHA
jgi:hypothetical protein